MPRTRTKTKKQVVVGETDLLDKSTGEIIQAKIISKEVESNFNFHKVWLGDLMKVTNNFGVKKMKVLEYLLNNMRNEDNSISTTSLEISKNTNVSEKTVKDTMKYLMQSNFMKKIRNGFYMVNPDILVKRRTSKRFALLVKYYNREEKRVDEEESIDQNI